MKTEEEASDVVKVQTLPQEDTKPKKFRISSFLFKKKKSREANTHTESKILDKSEKILNLEREAANKKLITRTHDHFKSTTLQILSGTTSRNSSSEQRRQMVERMKLLDER